MKTWKKIGNALLFPHIAILFLLLPVSVVFLVYAMIFLGTETPAAYASYVLAAYTLTVWCFRIPHLIVFFKTFRNENKYAKRWFEDARLRVNVSLYSSLLFNAVYAAFHLWLGYLHSSFWYCSLAGYYILLAIMRFFLVGYTKGHRPGEDMRSELVKYRACGWVFLIINLALTLMVFFMIYWNRTFNHHEITTIAMAAYTFTALVTSIVSIVKYKKYNSPVYSASKNIGLASAAVSMLTLETTMLTTFGQNEGVQFRRLMLAATGAVISVFIITMAVYMIRQGTKRLKHLKKTENLKDGKQ